MKRYILSTFMAASSLLAMGQAQALEIEIAPLKPQIKAEVLGIRADLNGQGVVQDALVLTGKSAALVANTAGLAIDTSMDMLVLTGKEVSYILNKTIGTTLEVGQTALIQTARFSNFALKVTLNIVKDSANFTVTAADAGFDLVKTVMNNTTKMSLMVISDSGRFVFAAANGIFGVATFAIRAVLSLIGIAI